MIRQLSTHIVRRSLTRQAAAKIAIGEFFARFVRVPPRPAVAAGLIPCSKPSGIAALAAATIFGIVTLLPAGAQPAKDPPPKEPLAKSNAAERSADGFPMPPGAIHRFGNRQFRHPEAIVGAAASPDGKYLATLGNSSVVVWDLKTQSAKYTITGAYFGGYGFGDRSGTLRFTPDSRSLLITTRPSDRTSFSINEAVELAQVWDMETGKKKFGLKGGWGFTFTSWLFEDGKEFALLSGYREAGSIKFFDAKDGKELRSVKVPLMNRGAWLAPNGRTIALVTDNNDGLVVFDTKSGDEIHRITGSRLIQAAFTPDGKRLVHHDDSNKVRVHDLESKKENFAFDHPADKQRGPMLFSKDQNTLYFGGQHGQLYRWDMKNNKRLPDVGRHSTWTLTALALSPDESILYSMGGDKLIRRWDLKTGKQLPLPEGYITQTAVVPTMDGKNLIIVDHVGTLDYWDLATGKHVKQLQPGNRGGFNCVAVSPDGRWFAGGRTVQDVQIWDLSTGTLQTTFGLVDKPDEKGSDHVQRVLFRSDSKVLYTTSGKTGVTAWEIPSGKKIWNANPGGNFAAADPAGRWIVVAGGFAREKIELAVLKPENGELLRRMDVQQEVNPDPNTVSYLPYVSDLTFTPDGARLVTAHYDGSIRIWDVQTGAELRRIKSSRTGNAGLACSPDGRWVGVARSDKSIVLWELATGKEIHVIKGHDSPPRDLVFTRDGRGIVGNADLAPILWSLRPADVPKLDGKPEEIWEGLASDDGTKAYKLQWALVLEPAMAIKLFSEFVKPGELTIARDQFDKWVDALDSPLFRAREIAERDLKRAGLKVPIAWLRKALADAKSDEAIARLKRILGQREKPDPNEWRLARVVQVLALAGTDDAKKLLRAWASSSGSDLAIDARAALERLK